MTRTNIELTYKQKIHLVKQEWFFIVGVVASIFTIISTLLFISNSFSREGNYYLLGILFILLSTIYLALFLTNKKADILTDGVLITATLVQSHKHEDPGGEYISYSVDYEYYFDDYPYLINLSTQESQNYARLEKLIISRLHTEKYILVNDLPIEVIDELRTLK